MIHGRELNRLGGYCGVRVSIGGSDGRVVAARTRGHGLMRGVARSTMAWVGLPLLSVCVMVGTGAVPAVVAPFAAPAAAASATHTTTYYAIGERICRQPKKLRVSACLIEKRTLVKQGTKGARAFTLAAGATGSATVGPAGGLTPSDLGGAYGLNTTGGAGQTVAIVDAFNDPNIAADLATFDSQYGLTTCALGSCLVVKDQTGGATLPANDTQGWSTEETLDVEAVHSVCEACKIILVEANSASNADLGTAENEAVSCACRCGDAKRASAARWRAWELRHAHTSAPQAIAPAGNQSG